MTMPWKLIALCLALAAQGASAQHDEMAGDAQARDERTPSKDLREEMQRIEVTVKDLYGRQETRRIPVLIFRPRGDGPFPLVIMNHGRATPDKRAQQGIQRYEKLSRYLVDKGFAVLLPTRVGYAETYGDFDPEANGECSSLRVDASAKAASDQVLATLEFAKTLPYVDTSRWLVMGQSMGGFTSIATVSRQPAGLVGGINFSGGSGGNPELRPGNPCSPARVATLWKAQAATARVPMLWLYWENDLFFGAAVPRMWHDAYVAGGGQAEFHQLPAAGRNGHGAINFDMNHWKPLVDAWLAKQGFDKPGAARTP